VKFVGKGQPLTGAGLNKALALLGLGVNDAAYIWTVVEVETAGLTQGFGFRVDRRPQILFERHMFRKYTNGRFDLDGFNDRLEFKTKLIPYTGDDSWVEPTLQKMKACMDGDMPPMGDSIMGGPCDFCMYARSRTELTLKALQAKKQ